MTDESPMNEINTETPGVESTRPMEAAVEDSMKQRQEQLTPPTHQEVLSKMDSFVQKSRELARKFANNKIVEWIPVVSPLIRSTLEYQKATTAAFTGKDVDTGMKLSGKERAKVAASSFGRYLWEDIKAKIDVAFLVAGGAIGKKAVERIGSKTVAAVVERVGIPLVRKGIVAGGDRVARGRVG